jgi:crotonobetainyl-CoA:carnitine CoA-transferase CaiB-like acyl-CoA transferase
VDDDLMGTLDIPGMPLRFSSFPGLLELRAASLGAHNHEVVCGLLGWSEDRYQSLVDAEVLLHTPIS